MLFDKRNEPQDPFGGFLARFAAGSPAITLTMRALCRRCVMNCGEQAAKRAKKPPKAS